MFQGKIKSAMKQGFFMSRLGRHETNSVVLTFDDGPDPIVTQQVLDRLEEYGARAIFFVVGHRIPDAPHLLKRILEQGHIIGNHTYIHSNNSQPGFVEYWRDVIRCQSLIEFYTGEKPKLFRPPGGRITLASLLVPRLLKLKTVMWSLDGQDWRFYGQNRALEISELLLRHLVVRDIILLHDDNPNTPLILDRILPVISNKRLDLRSGIECLA